MIAYLTSSPRDTWRRHMMLDSLERRLRQMTRWAASRGSTFNTSKVEEIRHAD
jgi:hypothetical protein